MKNKVILTICSVLITMISTSRATNHVHLLPLALQESGENRAAAIEWRRLALNTADPEERAGYYWAASYQYMQSEDTDAALKMLNKAEESSWNISSDADILRAAIAIENQNTPEAEYYFQSFERSQPASPEVKRFVNTKLSALAIKQGQPDAAMDYMQSTGHASTESQEAIEAYATARKRNPTVGGFLGLIPGLGYAYAGEYGNALRSLILNSIFIYGMIDTAEDEYWGAFAAITFFEITWYSGSIYGGIDASHRFNRNQRDELLRQIEGNANFAPDWELIPKVALQFQF